MFNYEQEKLNKFDKNIFLLDQEYREKNISNYYEIKFNSDENFFLYFFCSYYSLSKMEKQISNVFKSSNYNFKEMNYYQKFHKLCEIYSKDIKKKYKQVSKNERNENIYRINRKQENDFIKSRHKLYDILLYKVKSKEVRLIDRTLVLYFRSRSDQSEQVDYLEFSIMYYIIDWYINSGYSKVFNNINVVSRAENEYPHYLNSLFEKFNYRNVKNSKFEYEDFKNIGGLASNIVHFVHGNYNEIADSYFSTPIVSESYFFSKKSLLKSYVILDGIFFDKKNEYVDRQNFMKRIFFNDGRSRNNGDFTKLMQTILTSVVKLENKLIDESRKF